MSCNSFILLVAVIIVGMFFEQDKKTDQATVQDSTAQSTSDKSGPDLKKNDVTAPATQASEKFTDDANGKKTQSILN